MEMLQNWFAENQTILIDWAINIALALVIFIVGKMIVGIICSGTEKLMLKRGLDKTVASFLNSIINGVLLTFVVIAAIDRLGVESTSLVAILGAAGLAIGLALKDSLSNFASGVMLIMFRPFKAGDFVEAAGVAGVVEEVLIFSTRFKTGDNKEVIIPNGAITSGAITNYSAKPTRRIDLVIGVSYDADLKHAKQVLTDVVTGNEKVLKDPEPTIAVSELADSSVNFVVRPWVNTGDYWPVYFELMENIKIELDNAGIEIPYPHMSVVLNKEENNES